MSTERDFIDYVNDMINEINNIEFFSKEMDFEEFISDKKTYYATIRSLEIIGEACKKIPQTIREKYPHIPWIDIPLMRNKLAHEYFGVSLETVWFTIKNDLKDLKDVLNQLIVN